MKELLFCSVFLNIFLICFLISIKSQKYKKGIVLNSYIKYEDFNKEFYLSIKTEEANSKNIEVSSSAYYAFKVGDEILY